MPESPTPIMALDDAISTAEASTRCPPCRRKPIVVGQLSLVLLAVGGRLEGVVRRRRFLAPAG
jgi:hypothetical protein